MNDRLTVITLAGVARSGKDTIAKLLCVRHGFTRVALADGVRSAFDDLDGLTWELTKDLEVAGKASRWALQILGTECREATRSPRLWISLLLAKICYLAVYHPVRRPLIVVPDLRYIAEVAELSRSIPMDLGGRFFVWKVTRDGAGLNGDAAKHSSEAEIDRIPADLTIYNNGTIRDLMAVVDTYASQLLESR